MQYDILTIFPGIFNSFIKESLIDKAIKKNQIKVRLHDFRRFSRDKHHTVDDRPYGGGPGMIMKVEPISRCLSMIKRRKKSKVILLTPEGEIFDQRVAKSLSTKDQIILICGRYEGFDHRIDNLVDMKLSLGKYVLMGGEVAAMAVVEAVSRLIPGVLGQKASLREESFAKNLDYIEYPQYTRPPVFRGLKVPKILLSGDHKRIKEWRHKNYQAKK